VSDEVDLERRLLPVPAQQPDSYKALIAGFLVAGPVSGYLSDRYGARPFATGGMILAALSFIGLAPRCQDELRVGCVRLGCNR
jgi:hypothetical protein